MLLKLVIDYVPMGPVLCFEIFLFLLLDALNLCCFCTLTDQIKKNKKQTKKNKKQKRNKKITNKPINGINAQRLIRH